MLFRVESIARPFGVDHSAGEFASDVGSASFEW